jgi:Ring finger domain
MEENGERIQLIPHNDTNDTNNANNANNTRTITCVIPCCSLIRLAMQIVYCTLSGIQLYSHKGKSCPHYFEYVPLFIIINCIATSIRIIIDTWFEQQQLTSLIIHNLTRLSKFVNTTFIALFIICMIYFKCNGFENEYYLLITYFCIEYVSIFVLFILLLVLICCSISIPFVFQIIRFSRHIPIRIGATDDEINKLKMHKFIVSDNGQCSIKNMETGTVMDIGKEDAVCAICLSDYENNENLRYVLCTHHYHQECFDEWIKINASCPSCRESVNFN